MITYDSREASVVSSRRPVLLEQFEVATLHADQDHITDTEDSFSVKGGSLRGLEIIATIK